MPLDVGTLRFDPVGHRYWIGTRELLAVTQVLQTAGLVDATWFTEASRLRGAAIHQAAEALDRGELPGHVDVGHEPYLDGYRRFLQDARPVWHGLETPV